MGGGSGKCLTCMVVYSLQRELICWPCLFVDRQSHCGESLRSFSGRRRGWGSTLVILLERIASICSFVREGDSKEDGQDVCIVICCL